MTQDTQMVEVSAEMLAAYVDWEPPCEVDVTNPARALGLIRAAFFAGWNSVLSQQSVPGWQPIENKLLERRLGALMRLKNDIPQYMGDAPKAQHYQALHDALDASIVLLRQQPITDREPSNLLPTGKEGE